MNVRKTNICSVMGNLFRTHRAKSVNGLNQTHVSCPTCPNFLTSYLSRSAARVTPSAEYWLAK